MSKIKNKGLALLLSFLACHPVLNATVHIEDKTLTESEKEKDLQQPIAPKLSWIKRILKYSAYGIGGYSTLRTLGVLANAHFKSKMLSSLNEYKNLPYNERFKKFLKITDELMTEHNKHDKGDGKETWHMRFKRKWGNFWLWTEDDFSNDIFATIKNGEENFCAQCTHVLQTIAEYLGITAYVLHLYGQQSAGHAALLIKLENDQGGLSWLVIDGRNYIFNKQESGGKNYGLQSLEYFLEYWKKKYKLTESCILKRNVFSGLPAFLSNETVAVLNQKLLSRLANRKDDVNWADDDYVTTHERFIEQVKKTKN